MIDCIVSWFSNSLMAEHSRACPVSSRYSPSARTIDSSPYTLPAHFSFCNPVVSAVDTPADQQVLLHSMNRQPAADGAALGALVPDLQAIVLRSLDARERRAHRFGWCRVLSGHVIDCIMNEAHVAEHSQPSLLLMSCRVRMAAVSRQLGHVVQPSRHPDLFDTVSLRLAPGLPSNRALPSCLRWCRSVAPNLRSARLVFSRESFQVRE